MTLINKEESLKNVRTYNPKGEVAETRLYVKMGLLEHTYRDQFK